MVRLKNYLHKDKHNPKSKRLSKLRGRRKPKGRALFYTALHDHYKKIVLKERKGRQSYHWAKKGLKELLRGWNTAAEAVEDSIYHSVYELEKSRVIVCKQMSFKEEGKIASSNGKKKRKELAQETMSVQPWYIPINFRRTEEKAVLFLDKDYRHFATVQWRPSEEDHVFNQALDSWTAEVEEVPKKVPIHRYADPGTLSRSNGNYWTSHFRLRGKGSSCSAYAPNWDAGFYHNRKLLAPLVFSNAAETVRHRLARCLAIAHLPQYRKLDQWHRDGYIREHPFPTDWTTDPEVIARVEQAGAGLLFPFGGQAIKWPTKTAACLPHIDSGEEIYSPCTLMPYGRFKGGGLVLEQAGVILNLRHGDLCTFPASAIYHYNTPVTEGERGSTVNHIQAALTSYKKGKKKEDLFSIDDYQILTPSDGT